MPAGDAVNGDWWTSGNVGMWFCDGAPPESRWVFGQGRMRAAAGPKAGLCLCSTDEPLPAPRPPVPADPAGHNVSCPHGCRSAPCSGYPYCDPALSAQARAEDFVARLSLQEKANSIMWLGAQVPYGRWCGGMAARPGWAIDSRPRRLGFASLATRHARPTWV